MTPAFWYSPTRFSKKLVLPSSEMLSMKSKGFSTFQRFGQPSSLNTIMKFNINNSNNLGGIYLE